MKKMCLLIFLIPHIIYSQDPLLFSKVVNTDSVGISKLYENINDWFATNYKSAQNVIQMSDKESGTIIGKAITYYSYGKQIYLCYGGEINYTIKVNVKDNRFKVELINFIHTVYPGNSLQCALGLITTAENYTNKGMSAKYHNIVWNDIKKKMEAYSNDIFNSLENSIKSNLKTENDW
jgi:hypothetical protein